VLEHFSPSKYQDYDVFGWDNRYVNRSPTRIGKNRSGYTELMRAGLDGENSNIINGNSLIAVTNHRNNLAHKLIPATQNRVINEHHHRSTIHPSTYNHYPGSPSQSTAPTTPRSGNNNNNNNNNHHHHINTMGNRLFSSMKTPPHYRGMNPVADVTLNANDFSSKRDRKANKIFKLQNKERLNSERDLRAVKANVQQIQDEATQKRNQAYADSLFPVFSTKRTTM